MILMLTDTLFHTGDEVRLVKSAEIIDLDTNKADISNQTKKAPIGATGQVTNVWKANGQSPIYGVRIDLPDSDESLAILTTETGLDLVERYVPGPNDPTFGYRIDYESIAIADLSDEPLLLDIIQPLAIRLTGIGRQFYVRSLATLYDQIVGGRQPERLSDREVELLSIIQRLRREGASQATFSSRER